MRLKDKRAVVTGAGNGIGRAIAMRFAMEGARVLVAEIEEGPGNETVKSIREAGGDAQFCHTDISDEQSIAAMADLAAKEFDSVDVLVNNAAAFIFGDIENATMDDWQRVFAVNVTGPATCVRMMLPALRKAGGGAIVNIASVSGLIAQPKFVPYNSSKGALFQLTRCLAMDLAPDKIRVNAIAPGAVRTRATDRHIKSLGLDPETAYAEFARASVLNRMGTCEEIASAALFLASDEASFITGATLVVDGGATID